MITTRVEAAHEDDRGTIADLFDGQVDAVTRVDTKAGSVRGNHLHKETRQWTYVHSGCLLISTGAETTVVGPGDLVLNEPGEPHAWQALEDTVCIVFVQGPRAGHEYESDTYRLGQPLIVA